jgi:hypothetical protein
MCERQQSEHILLHRKEFATKIEFNKKGKEAGHYCPRKALLAWSTLFRRSILAGQTYVQCPQPVQ